MPAPQGPCTARPCTAWRAQQGPCTCCTTRAMHGNGHGQQGPLKLACVLKSCRPALPIPGRQQQLVAHKSTSDSALSLDTTPARFSVIERLHQGQAQGVSTKLKRSRWHDHDTGKRRASKSQVKSVGVGVAVQQGQAFPHARFTLRFGITSWPFSLNNCIRCCRATLSSLLQMVI